MFYASCLIVAMLFLSLKSFNDWLAVEHAVLALKRDVVTLEAALMDGSWRRCVNALADHEFDVRMSMADVALMAGDSQSVLKLVRRAGVALKALDDVIDGATLEAAIKGVRA